MTSRQRAGILLIVLGGVLFLSNMYPDVLKEIRQLISFPVILIAIGAYLFLTKR
jgi:uncharacterized membrane protein YfcA